MNHTVAETVATNPATRFPNAATATITATRIEALPCSKLERTARQFPPPQAAGRSRPGWLSGPGEAGFSPWLPRFCAFVLSFSRWAEVQPSVHGFKDPGGSRSSPMCHSQRASSPTTREISRPIVGPRRRAALAVRVSRRSSTRQAGPPAGPLRCHGHRERGRQNRREPGPVTVWGLCAENRADSAGRAGAGASSHHRGRGRGGALCYAGSAADLRLQDVADPHDGRGTDHVGPAVAPRGEDPRAAAIPECPAG